MPSLIRLKLDLYHRLLIKFGRVCEAIMKYEYRIRKIVRRNDLDQVYNDYFFDYKEPIWLEWKVGNINPVSTIKEIKNCLIFFKSSIWETVEETVYSEDELL